ncbi:MAG: hypothetical protein M3N05_05840 [Pseudomonadota bacterium]|jgi:Spy/CpxP family protein refolding chaperone|nr:hypothetical protein [Pseudomonadota bacterium]
MKIILAAIAAATALSAVAVAPASAQPYGHGWRHGHGWHHGYGHAPRRVCVIRYHHRVCRWVR